MKKPWLRFIKKAALENGIPQDGAVAYSQGWPRTACPFNFDPAKEKWIAEWDAACTTAFNEFMKGNDHGS